MNLARPRVVHIWVYCKLPTGRFGAEAALTIETGWRGTRTQMAPSARNARCSITSAEEGGSQQRRVSNDDRSIPEIVFPLVTSLVQTAYGTDDVSRSDNGSPNPDVAKRNDQLQTTDGPRVQDTLHLWRYIDAHNSEACPLRCCFESLHPRQAFAVHEPHSATKHVWDQISPRRDGTQELRCKSASGREFKQGSMPRRHGSAEGKP
jgi:hypothetical protein